MSVRGGDAAGETVARAIATAGIRDLSVTFLDRSTPSYTALLDRSGDVIAALADMGLYDLAFAKQLRRASVREAVRTADAMFCDANLVGRSACPHPETGCRKACLRHRHLAGEGGPACPACSATSPACS